MASVSSIISGLCATNSRLEKEAILQKNCDNQLLKDAFRLALDPTLNFYIKKVPEPIASSMVSSLADVLKMLETDLASRRVRGGEAQRRVAYALGSLEPDDQEVVRRVIGRNLKCGCSDSTVQKIWPYLNLSWPCMLVSGMNEKTKLKFPMIAQTKMDGMRFNAVVQGGAVTYRSRNGKELDIFGVLDDDFLRMAAGEDLVFDGELLVWGSDGKPMDRKTGNGLLTKFQKETGTPEIAKRIRAMVWDRIPLADFRKGSCQLTYSTRLFALNSASKETSKVQVLKTTMINSISIAQTLYQEQLAQGEEGIILKDPAGIWEDKRVKHQVKMKAELEADLVVTGFTPGTGKYEGKIGSLEVQSADGKVKTSVGTGLSDEERSLDFKKEFEGRIVAVKYNALINDKKTGALSVFLPVFVEVREDKTVADIL
jgi:ATP dependent DNA ligase domain/DNA ligase OB-like domain